MAVEGTGNKNVVINQSKKPNSYIHSLSEEAVLTPDNKKLSH